MHAINIFFDCVALRELMDIKQFFLLVGIAVTLMQVMKL